MRSHLVLYLEERLQHNNSTTHYVDLAVFVMYRRGAYRLFVTRSPEKEERTETRLSFPTLNGVMRFLHTNFDWEDGRISLEVHFIKLMNSDALQQFGDLWIETGKGTELSAFDHIRLITLRKHLRTLAAVRVEDVSV